MRQELKNSLLEINDTDITFESIYNKKYIPHQYIEDIKKANFLIIPNENFRNEGDVLFPETTRDFFDYIKDNANNKLIPDIAISDEDFKRIELHSATIEIATIIVQSALFQIAIGLITSFIYDLIKKHRRNSKDTNAKVKILVEESESKKSKMIIYDGPVSEIKDTLDKVSEDLFSNGK